MSDNKPMYAVKRINDKTKFVEWFTIDDDGRHNWTDNRERRELLGTKPDLYAINRAAGWRHFIVTVGGKPGTMSVLLARNEYVLFDVTNDEVYVIDPTVGGSTMTFIGTSFSSVVDYFRHKKS